MKPAAEFEQIDGRFKGIDELLAVCRARAEETHDMECVMLVSAVQRLSREVRSLEKSLLADDLGILKDAVALPAAFGRPFILSRD